MTRMTRRDLLGSMAPADGAAALGVTQGGAQALGGRRVTIHAKPAPIEIELRKTAVLIVDMQNDFGSKGGMFDRAGIDISGIQRAVGPTKRTLAAARAAGIDIVYLKMAYHSDLSDLGTADSVNRVRHLRLGVGQAVAAPDGRPSRIPVRDTWNTDIVSELTPYRNDTIVDKTRFSGFYKTDLDEILRRRGLTHLIVTGCTTSICVESTVRDAMFRDYSCVLLADCMAEPIGNELPRSNHEASLLSTEVLLGCVSDSNRFVQAVTT